MVENQTAAGSYLWRRIYLRVHYASDVIAGFCFGMLSLLILMWLLKQIEKYNAKIIPPALNITKAEQ